MLTEEVYEALRALLMNLDIAPGERINIGALARSMGVSVTPIRESLARLESESLVRKTPLVGYAATATLSWEQLAAMYDVRLALEPLAASRAATRATTQDLEAIEATVVAMRNSPGGERWEDYGSVALEDANFHRAIAAAAGNEFLFESLERLHAHLHLYRLYFRQGIERVTLSEHEAILTALRSGSADEAAAAMRAHLVSSKDRLVPASKVDRRAQTRT